MEISFPTKLNHNPITEEKETKKTQIGKERHTQLKAERKNVFSPLCEKFVFTKNQPKIAKQR